MERRVFSHRESREAGLHLERLLDAEKKPSLLHVNEIRGAPVRTHGFGAEKEVATVDTEAP